jgi:MFS family permease
LVVADKGPAGGEPPASSSRDLLQSAAPGAWYSVWLICAVTMIQNVDRSIINLLVQPIKRDLMLSDTEIGLILGLAFSLFYMAIGLPLSRLADRRSRKVILAIGLAIWSVATGLSGAAKSFAQLFAMRGVVGGAESVAGPSTMSMISDLVPRRKLPRAFAIYQFNISAGQMGALFLGGALLALFTRMGPIDLPLLRGARPWQLTFLACMVPGLLLAIVLALTVREPERRGPRRPDPVPVREVARYVATHRAIYLPLLLSIGIHAIDSMGLTAWRPAFYERTYGWAPQHIGALLGMSMLISTPIALVGGTWLAERLSRNGKSDAMVRACLYCQLMSAPFTIATPLMPTAWAALACGTIGTTFGLMSAPAQNSAIQLVTPGEIRAQISALYLFTISAIGMALGPLVVALATDFVLKNEGMLRYSMSGFAMILAPIGILMMWKAMKPYGLAVARMHEQ